MQLIFRFSIDPSKYGKRFGLDIPDDSMDDIGIGGGSLPEGETGDGSDEDGASAQDSAIAEDTEYSSNAPSRQCQTTIENCRAPNPLTCPYHGLKVIKQDIEGFLRQRGVNGSVEVVNDNQSQSGRKRNDFAAIINCEPSQADAVKEAMRQFFALPGIRGDARDVGYDDDDGQSTGTFEIDLLDPNATRYTSGRNPADAPAAEPAQPEMETEEVAEEVEEEAPTPAEPPASPSAERPVLAPTPRSESSESPATSAPSASTAETLLADFERQIENFPDMSLRSIQESARNLVAQMREALAAQQQEAAIAPQQTEPTPEPVAEPPLAVEPEQSAPASESPTAEPVEATAQPAEPTTSPSPSPSPTPTPTSNSNSPAPDRASFMARNTRPELANQAIADDERASILSELSRANENVRTLSQRAADQSLSEDDRKDSAKVRNRYSSYAKSLRAILGGADASALDTAANREEIARNCADWVRAVREVQVDARNEDGSFRTDENGRRVKVRNGTNNTAYKRAVDAANFIGSRMGFSIQDFDTSEGGDAPAIAWTGEHPEHRLSFHDVESFRAHRAALQSANGQSAQPQSSAAPAAPAPSPSPAATPAPSPTPAPAPAAEPTPPPAAPTTAPEPQTQQAAPATERPSPAPSAAPAARRNFASVARQAQQRRGGIQNANMASMLDRIRQRAQNLQNGANNG